MRISSQFMIMPGVLPSDHVDAGSGASVALETVVGVMGHRPEEQ